MGPPVEPRGAAKRVQIGHVSVELPVSMARQPGEGVDTAAAVFKGGGVTVIVDAGPFADRLDSYGGRAGFRAEAQGGGGGQTISFRNPGRGTFTVATRISGPKPATILVEADASLPEEAARRIIASVKLTN